MPVLPGFVLAIPGKATKGWRFQCRRFTQRRKGRHERKGTPPPSNFEHNATASMHPRTSLALGCAKRRYDATAALMGFWGVLAQGILEGESGHEHPRPTGVLFKHFGVRCEARCILALPWLWNVRNGGTMQPPPSWVFGGLAGRWGVRHPTRFAAHRPPLQGRWFVG
jgi:hypothetical protein